MGQNEKTTRADVQVAFIALHEQGELQSAAYDEWSELTFDGAERIVTALVENLWRYRRPADGRFTLWATAWVRRQTRRHRFLTELFRQYPQLIFSAINRGMYCSAATDAAVEPCDGEADLYRHLLEHPRKIDALMSPKRAKVSTMLFSLVKSQTRAFRKRITVRRAAVARRLRDQSGIECEQANPQEEVSENLVAA